MSNDIKHIEPTVGDEIVEETHQEPNFDDKVGEHMTGEELRERIVLAAANIALFKEHVAKRRDQEAKQDREAWAKELERWANQHPSSIEQAQQVFDQTKAGTGIDWAALDRKQLEALAEAFEAQSSVADAVGGERYKQWLGKHIGPLAQEIQKDCGDVEAESARKAAKIYALQNFSKLYAEQDALKKSWQKDLLRIGGKVALAAFTGNPIGAVFAVIDIAKTLTKDRTADVEAYQQSAKGFDGQAQAEADKRGIRADSPKRGFVTGRWAAVVGGAVVAGLAIAGIDAGLDSGLIQVDKAAAAAELDEIKGSAIAAWDSSTAALDGAAEFVSNAVSEPAGISVEEGQAFANYAQALDGLEGTLETTPEGAGAPGATEAPEISQAFEGYNDPLVMPKVPMPLGMEAPLASSGKEALESIVSKLPEAENLVASLDVAAETPVQEPAFAVSDNAVSGHSNGSVSITTGVWGDGVDSIDSISDVCDALGVDSTPENWEKIAGFIGSDSVDLIQANTQYHFTPEQLAELGYQPEGTLSLAQQHAQFGGNLVDAPEKETLSLAAQHAAHSHSIDGSEAVVVTSDNKDDGPAPS